MPLGTEVGLGLRDIVLDGDPAPPPLKVHSPQFSASVRCGQTAGWIKITLGINVEHGPGHIVLDGDQAPSRKTGAEPPIIGPFLLWPNAWMHQDATLPLAMEVCLCPGDCVRWGRSSHPKKGTDPNSRLMSTAAKRLDGSRCHLVRR